MVELDTDESGTVDFAEFYTWYQAEASQNQAKNRLGVASLAVAKFVRYESAVVVSVASL